MAQLTPRELDVMVEIATGDTFAEIARRLGMHEQTVKNHANSARRKAGVATNIEWFRLKGWLVPEGVTITTESATDA